MARLLHVCLQHCMAHDATARSWNKVAHAAAANRSASDVVRGAPVALSAVIGCRKCRKMMLRLLLRLLRLRLLVD